MVRKQQTGFTELLENEVKRSSNKQFGRATKYTEDDDDDDDVSDEEDEYDDAEDDDDVHVIEGDEDDDEADADADADADDDDDDEDLLDDMLRIRRFVMAAVRMSKCCRQSS